MRTNILLDDKLIQKALTISGLKTTEEVINMALLEFVENYMRLDLIKLKGKIEFSKNYDYKNVRD